MPHRMLLLGETLTTKNDMASNPEGRGEEQFDISWDGIIRDIALRAALLTFMVLVTAYFQNALSIYVLVFIALVIALDLGFRYNHLLGPTIRPMVRLEEGTVVPKTQPLRVAHLSDLHIPVIETMEERLPSAPVTENVSAAIKWAASVADIVAITGDVTDSGAEQEWAIFESICFSLSEDERKKILFVPGNHDLTVLDGPDLDVVAESSTRQNTGFDTRCWLLCQSLTRLSGLDWKFESEGKIYSVHRVLQDAKSYADLYRKNPPGWVLNRNIQATSPNIEVFRPSPHLESFVAQATRAGSIFPNQTHRSYRDAVALLYPMAMFENDGFLVIGVNSSFSAAAIAPRAAIGTIGRSQRRRLAKLLEKAGNRAVIILVHHHIGFPPRVFRKLWALRSRKLEKKFRPRIAALAAHLLIKFLAVTDASATARLLRQISRCVVLHGHKHIGYQACLGKARIISSPSVTFGDELRPGELSANISVYEIDRNGMPQILEVRRLVPNRAVVATIQ